MAILSNGTWLCFMVASSINSSTFCYFIDKLFGWLKANLNFGFRERVITLDNCPSHRGQKTISKLRGSDCNICFLPPYSPSLAPIEMCFGILKQRVKKQNRHGAVKLNQHEGPNSVFTALRKINENTVVGLFQKFYRELRKYYSV